MAGRLFSVENLTVGFETEFGRHNVLNDVSFAIDAGKVIGIVGESGSGKSVSALAIMRLLGPQGFVQAGKIQLGGLDLLSLDEAGMRQLRGRRISMIFQEPMTSLNPLFTVGYQVAEVLNAHLGLTGRAARKEVVGWFKRVGIPNPETRFDDYPHALSGGTRQRVMIAMAMACRPELLVADEPTTALDVTIQAQILDLMNELRREHGTAIILITHDMGVIARMANEVAVMYAGEVAETGTLRDVLTAPAHPYTRRLLAAMPTARRRSDRLPVIPGTMPSPSAILPGCRFQPRCPEAVEICSLKAPPLFPVERGGEARCWLTQCATAAGAGTKVIGS